MGADVKLWNVTSGIPAFPGGCPSEEGSLTRSSIRNGESVCIGGREKGDRSLT